MSLQHQMTSKEFEELVKNVDCYRKRKIPDYFYINLKIPVEKTKQKKSKMDSPLDIKHDWYSNGHKRSLFSFNAHDLGKDDEIDEFDNPSEDFDKNDRIEIVENVDQLSYETPAVQNNLLYEEFQKLYIGADGVYRSSKERMKRSSDLKTLSRHLRNLPSILIPTDHIYVIQGDMVVMSCDPSRLDSDVSWSADGDLLNQDNAIVGDTVVIEDVNVKNAGNYTCSKGGAWHRSMQVVVVALPYFQINSQPIYEINKRCTLFDLKSAQFLGKEMAQVACFEERYCSFRIERPACLRDTEKRSWLVSLTAAMVVSPRHVQCGMQCQRDLHCSLALLSAGNAPVLESIKVMVAMKDTNRTWLPASRQDRTFIVTRTLKGKESNCIEEHGKRNADLEPGDVAVTATCPPGFYLVSESKICFAIPPKRYKDTAFFKGHKRLKSGGADLSASSVCACAWALCALASATRPRRA